MSLHRQKKKEKEIIAGGHVNRFLSPRRYEMLIFLSAGDMPYRVRVRDRDRSQVSKVGAFAWGTYWVRVSASLAHSKLDHIAPSFSPFLSPANRTISRARYDRVAAPRLNANVDDVTIANKWRFSRKKNTLTSGGQWIRVFALIGGIRDVHEWWSSAIFLFINRLRLGKFGVRKVILIMFIFRIILAKSLKAQRISLKPGGNSGARHNWFEGRWDFKIAGELSAFAKAR